MYQGKGLTKEALQVSEKQAVPGGNAEVDGPQKLTAKAPEKGYSWKRILFDFGMVGPLFFGANC